MAGIDTFVYIFINKFCPRRQVKGWCRLECVFSRKLGVFFAKKSERTYSLLITSSLTHSHSLTTHSHSLTHSLITHSLTHFFISPLPRSHYSTTRPLLAQSADVSSCTGGLRERDRAQVTHSLTHSLNRLADGLWLLWLNHCCDAHVRHRREPRVFV
jgi:hypothetical protein